MLNRGLFIQNRPHDSELRDRLDRFRIDKSLSEKLRYTRVGASDDGGYVIPYLCEEISMCLSAGVDHRMTFEDDLYKEFGIPSDMIDGSMKTYDKLPEYAKFRPINLAPISDEGSISLNDWVKEHTGDLLLQMDIEGHEYSCICSSTKETLSRFRILVIEIHDFFQIFSDTLINPVVSLMDKIAETHTIVHIHCNNSSKKIESKYVKATNSLECTFLRNDWIPYNEDASVHHRNPKSFDRPNNPQAEDVVFKIKF